MSYCRFGVDASDVYIYPDSRHEAPNNIVCCWCLLTEAWPVFDASGMLSHIAEHQRAGHRVPDYAIARLVEEAATIPPPAAAPRESGKNGENLSSSRGDDA